MHPKIIFISRSFKFRPQLRPFASQNWCNVKISSKCFGLGGKGPLISEGIRMWNYWGFPGTLLKPTHSKLQLQWKHKDLDGLHHCGVILGGLNYRQASSTWRFARQREIDLETEVPVWDKVSSCWLMNALIVWFLMSGFQTIIESQKPFFDFQTVSSPSCSRLTIKLQ